MNVRFRFVAWVFNRALWSQTIKAWVAEFGAKEVANLLGVSTGAISGWIHMEKNPDYQWPSMTCFMRAVNELDLDPSEFFTTED